MASVGLLGIVVILVIAIIAFFTMQNSYGAFSKNENIMSELLQNQLISSEQAENIKNYYKSKKENSNIGIVILSIIGVVLIVLGVILFVAHNWNTIPKVIKLIISISILLFAQLVFYRNIYKKKTSLFAVEGSSIFLSGMVAATIALIGQIYNLPGSFESFLFTWMILILPIPYLYNSVITSMIYFIGISLWFATGNYYGQSEIILFKNFIFILLMIPFAIMYIKKNKATIRARFLELELFLVILYCFTAIITLANNILSIALAFNVLIISIYFVSCFFSNLNLVFTKVLSQLAVIIQMLILVFITENDNVPKLDYDILNKNVIGNSVVGILLLTALFGFYYFARKKQYENLLFSLTTTVLAIFNYSFDSTYLFYMVNLYLIVLAVYLIYTSSVSRNIYKLNVGLLITIILVLKWFFNSGAGIIETSLGFIIMGILLMLFNLKMVKSKKGVKNDEETTKPVEQ